MRFILASASRRRTDILKSCRIRHKIFVTGIKEASHGRFHAARLVIENAKRKARAVAGNFKSGIVLGADTVVLFKGKNIGKPKTAMHARKMLKSFSGRHIVVYTGLFLIDVASGRCVYGVEKTGLKVKKIIPADIDKYLAALGPPDKAGGFSIEGAGSLIFDDIRGSYFNVLGLPMAKLAELFKKLEYDIFDFMR